MVENGRFFFLLKCFYWACFNSIGLQLIVIMFLFFLSSKFSILQLTKWIRSELVSEEKKTSQSAIQMLNRIKHMVSFSQITLFKIFLWKQHELKGVLFLLGGRIVVFVKKARLSFFQKICKRLHRETPVSFADMNRIPRFIFQAWIATGNVKVRKLT